MDKNYWVQFWKDYTSNLNNLDEQSQVLRTLNKKPITTALWEYTLGKLDESFEVQANDEVLDLCSGNGLLSKFFVSKGAFVTAVDVSEELLQPLDAITNITTLESDIRVLNFEPERFDKIIIYAGIQYFSHKEALEIIQNCYRWLKQGGELFIGDVPDGSKTWTFFNTPERQSVYFKNVLNDTAVVGTWFDRKWFEYLTLFIGFKEGLFIEQDEQLIYSSFRFDFKYRK